MGERGQINLRKLYGTIAFLSGIGWETEGWTYFWEFIRGAVYGAVWTTIAPYLVQWGPTALFIGVGVYFFRTAGRTTDRGRQSTKRKWFWAHKADPITWNFERNFLGWSGAKDGMVVSAFQGSAKNNSDASIEKIAGFVRRRDNKTYPLCVHINGPVKLEDTKGIPPHSEVNVFAPFYVNNRFEEYIPIISFIAEFPPLFLQVEYDGHKYERTFSKEDVQKLLIEFTDLIWEQNKPKITSR